MKPQSGGRNGVINKVSISIVFEEQLFSTTVILFLSLCGGRNPEKSETVDSWELFERHQHFCQQIAGGLQPLEGLFSFAWLFRRDGNYWFFLSVTGVGTVHPHIITYLPSGTKRLVVNAVSGLTSMYIHTHTRRKVKPIWILLKQETVSGSGEVA